MTVALWVEGMSLTRAHLTPVVARVRPTTPASFHRALGFSCQYGSAICGCKMTGATRNRG